MSSGVGTWGGESRCYKFWRNYSHCYRRASVPEECILEAADYKECLKGSKTNIRIYEVFSEREAQVRKASGAAEPAGSHGHH